MQSVAGIIGRGTLWLSSGNVVVKIASLAYLTILLSNLSLFEYGLSKLALSIPPLLSILFLSGLQNVMVVDLLSLQQERSFTKMRALFASFISAKTIAGALGFLVLGAACMVLQGMFSDELLQLMLILSTLFLVSPLRAVTTLSFEVSKNYKLRSWLDMSDEIIKVALVFTLLAIFDWGVIGVVVATVISAVVSTLLFLPVAYVGMREELGGAYAWGGAVQPLAVFRAHAKWSLFLDSLNSVSLHIRPWIIQFFLGINAVGIYGIAMALLNPLKSLVPIGQVILPIVPQYANDKARITQIINSAIKYKIYIQIVLIAGAITLLPVLFHFFPEYAEAQWLFIAMTAMFIPNAFLQMFGTVFQTYKMQKNMFAAAAANFLLVISLLPIAIMLFGIYGVAVELFITQCVFVYFRLQALRGPLPDYRIPLSEILSITETDRWLFHKVVQKFLPKCKVQSES